MLKKAGIITAAAVAGVLAIAPFAFAGENNDHSPSCAFANGSESGNDQGAAGFLGLIGGAGTAANAAAPVTAQTNAPVGSCNNISDVIDSDSNNKTKTIDNTKTVDNSVDVNKSSSVFDVFTGLFG